MIKANTLVKLRYRWKNTNITYRSREKVCGET